MTANKLYSYNELSASARERVIEREAKRVYETPEDLTLQKCMESLKAVASALGVKLTDWSIGAYNRNNFARVNSEECGNKAVAHFVRVLIARGYKRQRTFRAMLEPGTGSFVGVCGFTGVCHDDDICESLLSALLAGETMSEAFSAAAERIREICETELEYRASREGILETLDRDAEIYTEDGSEFRRCPVGRPVRC